MHPAIIEAAAAERRREMQAYAAAAERARGIRRSRRAQQARRPAGRLDGRTAYTRAEQSGEPIAASIR